MVTQCGMFRGVPASDTNMYCGTAYGHIQKPCCSFLACYANGFPSLANTCDAHCMQVVQKAVCVNQQEFKLYGWKCIAGSGASGRLSQGTTSTAFGERSQGRPPQQSDSRPTSPIHPSPSPLSSSGDGNELRQLVAGLQSQNSQLIHVNKQQQSTIANLEVTPFTHASHVCPSFDCTWRSVWLKQGMHVCVIELSYA